MIIAEDVSFTFCKFLSLVSNFEKMILQYYPKYIHVYREANSEKADGRKGGRTNGRTEGWTDRQTDVQAFPKTGIDLLDGIANIAKLCV